jgi:hypothetical protein
MNWHTLALYEHALVGYLDHNTSGNAFRGQLGSAFRQRSPLPRSNGKSPRNAADGP